MINYFWHWQRNSIGVLSPGSWARAACVSLFVGTLVDGLYFGAGERDINFAQPQSHSERSVLVCVCVLCVILSSLLTVRQTGTGAAAGKGTM